MKLVLSLKTSDFLRAYGFHMSLGKKAFILLNIPDLIGSSWVLGYNCLQLSSKPQLKERRQYFPTLIKKVLLS